MTRKMCFSGRGTHITRDMCFLGRGTHITRDMCFAGRGTHLTRDTVSVSAKKKIDTPSCVTIFQVLADKGMGK